MHSRKITLFLFAVFYLCFPFQEEEGGQQKMVVVEEPTIALHRSQR